MRPAAGLLSGIALPLFSQEQVQAVPAEAQLAHVGRSAFPPHRKADEIQPQAEELVAVAIQQPGDLFAVPAADLRMVWADRHIPAVTFERTAGRVYRHTVGEQLPQFL